MLRNFVIISLLVVVGCSSEPDETTTDTPTTGSPTITYNALTGNALTGNALTGNALTGNALTGNALTGNALTGNALTGNALASNALTGNALTGNGVTTEGEQAREVLRYIYSCAMPAGSRMTLNIDGVDYTFDGAIGLAPEWGEEGGSCDKTCQRWISACLMARTNAYGVPVPISIRGNHPAISTVSAEEMALFPIREGSYYGSVFAGNPYGDSKKACTGPGSNLPDETYRFCSNSGTAGMFGSPCNFFVSGQCHVEDPEPGSISKCAGIDASNGAVQHCDFADSDGGVQEVITVYLQVPQDRCGNTVCEPGEDPTTCPDCSAGWAKSLERAVPTALRVDNDKTILVAAASTINKHSQTVDAPPDLGGGVIAGSGGFFLARYNAAGVYQSAMRIGSGEVNASDIATDAAGNIYVSGSFAGTSSMGGSSYTSELDWTDNYKDEGFVAKYTSAGVHVWSVRLGSTVKGAYQIVVDGNGDPVIAGDTHASSIFIQRRSKTTGALLASGSTSNFGVTSLEMDSAGRFLVSKYQGAPVMFSPALVQLWVAPEWGTGALDGNGTLYVTGSNAISKYTYDDTAVAQVWYKAIDAGNEWAVERPLHSVVDGEGNLVVAGDYSPELLIGTYRLATEQMIVFNEGFAAKLTPTGDVIWVRGLKTSKDGTIYDLATDGGDVIVAGPYEINTNAFGFLVSQDVDRTSFISRFDDNLVGNRPNDLVGGAIPIEPSETTQTFAGSTLGLTDDYQASCGARARGADAVYRFTLGAPRRVILDAAGSSYDTVLHVRDASSTGAEVGCNDDNGASGQSRLDMTLGAGTYLVFVDGKSNAAGNYQLSLTIDVPVEGDTTTDPRIVSESNRGGRFYGDTTGLSNEETGSCGGAGADAIYKITLTKPSHLHADTASSSFDTALYLRPATGQERGCNDDANGTKQASLDLDLPPGTYYLVVDGAVAGQEGMYRVDIFLSPPETQLPIANAGPDQTISCLLPGEVRSVSLDGSASSDPDGDPLTFDWQQAATPIAAGSNPTLSLGAGSYAIDLLVSDGVYTITDSVTVSLVADTTAPTLVPNGGDLVTECGVPFVDPGATATDVCDGDTSAAVTASGTVDTSVPGPYSRSYQVTDAAGNMATAHRTVTVVDTMAPHFTSTPGTIAVVASSIAGNAVSFELPTAVDGCAGAAPVVCSHASGATFPLGTTAVSCTATDDFGNAAATTFYVSVTYAWSNFLDPVNTDGTSVFKLGGTIPLRFQLTGDSAVVTNATAKLTVAKIWNGIIGTEVEATSTAAASTGNTFVYNGGHYFYNLSTRNLSMGTWQIRVDLGDGVVRTVLVSLK